MTKKLYIGTQIANATPMTRQEYGDLRGWTVPENENPEDAGYLIEQVDGGAANVPGFSGYVSWCPLDAFFKMFRSAENMAFSEALSALKKGECVFREKWNGVKSGKSMWLFLVKGGGIANGIGYGFGEYPGEPTVADSIAMKTADNRIVVGWAASQDDILAEDWAVATDGMKMS